MVFILYRCEVDSFFMVMLYDDFFLDGSFDLSDEDDFDFLFFCVLFFELFLFVLCLNFVDLIDF